MKHAPRRQPGSRPIAGRTRVLHGGAVVAVVVLAGWAIAPQLGLQAAGGRVSGLRIAGRPVPAPIAAAPVIPAPVAGPTYELAPPPVPAPPTGVGPTIVAAPPPVPSSLPLPAYELPAAPPAAAGPVGLPAGPAAEPIAAPPPAAAPVTNRYTTVTGLPTPPCGPSCAAGPGVLKAVDCADGTCCGEAGWGAGRPLPFQPLAQGEYVGHYRQPHVCEYRLRVDDVLDVVFRRTRDEQTQPYRLNVGDSISIESVTDAALNRDELIVQPDGSITLRLLGQVHAGGLTIDELRERLEEQYQQFYTAPSIVVTPRRVNSKLDDLLATVDARNGFGGQSRQARVAPDGTIALPALGSVPAQGLTLDELKRELDARYAAEVEGIEVTPILVTRAPRNVYVLGEVKNPGRYALEGPTTVMQSLSMAGGWNLGANTRQIVIFRRGDDWRLLATLVDLRGALYGRSPCPADELWINDSDVVLVPKAPILVFDDMLNLIFTQGLYRISPFNTSVAFGYQGAL